MIELGRLFAGMGMMYAWATKEYLFWEMTIGQIILYYNKGIEIKYPQTEKGHGNFIADIDELKKIRDQMKVEKAHEETMRSLEK